MPKPKDEVKETDVLLEISEKLDSVLAFLAVQTMDSDARKDADAVVTRLQAFGMGPRAISRVTGDTENAVGKRLRRLQQKDAKRATKPGHATSAAPLAEGDADATE